MQLIVGANQLLRVYALYGLDRRIAAFIALTAAAVVAISVWAVTMQKDSDAGMGCHLMISSDTADRLSIVWASLFVYNLLIFALMLIKAPKNRAQLAQAKRGSLVTIVYRDGVMYFAVVVCVQCADFISFYVFPPALKGALSTLASSISLTMMSRCILNLHEYDAQVRGVTGVSEMYSLGCPAPIAGASDCFGEQSV
ncbi:hypothetical protein PsYK624_040900 [Phanerochaete sordida]|uniref:Uncharacterized protein n=1 Tax=Phanerochaete sordida TaxID=48140 RepID=A0A9P3G4L8_9APHY|nr:hypothetical protein PsYK624_040900 [Phanerochaete sordida]